MSPGDRLKQFMKDKNLNQQDFASEVNVKYSSLNKMINGHKDIKYDFIDKLIKRFPEIDLNWLLRDESNPFVTMKNSKTYRPQSLANLITEMEEVVEKLKKQIL